MKIDLSWTFSDMGLPERAGPYQVVQTTAEGRTVGMAEFWPESGWHALGGPHILGVPLQRISGITAWAPIGWLPL